MRQRSLATTVAMIVALALAIPQLAASAPADLRAEREQVRSERAKVASEIDVTKASLAEVDEALQILNENVRAQESALAEVEAEVAKAENDIAKAEATIERLTGEIEVLVEVLRARAVQSYVNPPGTDALSVLGAQDFTTAANHKFYLELRSQDEADVADRLNGANSDVEHQRSLASEARELAEAKRVEQAERTESVKTARAEQQRVASQIEAVMDSQVARSLELAATDRDLSRKIAEEQAALAARVAAQKAAAEAAAKQRAAAATTSRGGGGGGGGPIAPTAPGGPVGTSSSGIRLCAIQSARTNCQIVDQLANMISAAAADGVNLRVGNSFRDSANQIRLRQQHCGSSHYAVYQMSASSCRPPTARPGTSQHEIGLAIDFQSCSTRSTACYRWLASNASRFGFYNLPSEAWHWSTTGS